MTPSEEIVFMASSDRTTTTLPPHHLLYLGVDDLLRTKNCRHGNGTAWEV